MSITPQEACQYSRSPWANMGDFGLESCPRKHACVLGAHVRTREIVDSKAEFLHPRTPPMSQPVAGLPHVAYLFSSALLGPCALSSQ